MARPKGPRGLGDYLNDTFSLVPRIWKEALPISCLAVLPGAILFVVAMGSMSGLVGDLSANTEWPSEDPAGFLGELSLTVLAFAGLSLLQFLGAAYQKAFICLRTGAELEGRKPRLLVLAREALGRPWLRVAIQDAAIAIVVGSLTSSLALIAMLPMIASAADLASSSMEYSTSFVFRFIWLYLAVGLASFCVSWFIAVRTGVSAPASLLERRNSIEGIGRSMHLTKRGFWRVFGAMFLVSLVISFGLGIATGPITFGLAAPGYFSFLSDSLSGSTPSTETILSLLRSLGWAIGIGMAITGIVQGTLWPAFLTVLYADLKKRAGENSGLTIDAPRIRGSRRRRLLANRAFDGPDGCISRSDWTQK